MASEQATVHDKNVAATPATRQLSNAEFQTAMVHLYRGEVGRANTWRTRLDGTTNWAVLTTAATLSFAFANSSNTHVMILINSLLVFFFMYIEARRYRFYDLWRARIRLIEIEFFADMLAPGLPPDLGTWRALLADDLLHPRFSISMRTALARRLQRNYVWLFGVLLASWVVKVFIHPFPTQTPVVLLARISIGPIPAWFVLLFGACFNIALVVLLIANRESAGREDETLARHEARERMGTGEEPNQ
jgi:uncharacterized membrane protein